MRSISQVFIADSKSELEATIVDITFSAMDFMYVLPTSRFSQLTVYCLSPEFQCHFLSGNPDHSELRAYFTHCLVSWTTLA